MTWTRMFKPCPLDDHRTIFRIARSRVIIVRVIHGAARRACRTLMLVNANLLLFAVDARTSARSCERACSPSPAAKWKQRARSAFTGAQGMAYVILPQALRNMVSALVTQMIVLLIVNNCEIKPFELYLFIAVIYWICMYSMSRLARRMERRLSIA